MNEKQTSRIVKESMRSPSTGFTDEVMKQVEMEPLAVKKSRQTVIWLWIGCIVCTLLLIMISLPEFTLRNYQIDISPLFIQIPGIIFIFYEIRQIKDIRKNIERYKELTPTH